MTTQGTKTIKTILVVEDSPTQAMRLQSLLSSKGIATLWGSDGIEGLNIAQEFHPDAVILDIQLPQMNGLQVCKQLKENKKTADIPIILLTQIDDMDTAVFGFRVGAIEFIPKDAFSDAVLIETLRQKGLIDS